MRVIKWSWCCRKVELPKLNVRAWIWWFKDGTNCWEEGIVQELRRSVSIPTHHQQRHQQLYQHYITQSVQSPEMWSPELPRWAAVKPSRHWVWSSPCLACLFICVGLGVESAQQNTIRYTACVSLDPCSPHAMALVFLSSSKMRCLLLIVAPLCVVSAATGESRLTEPSWSWIEVKSEFPTFYISGF